MSPVPSPEDQIYHGRVMLRAALAVDHLAAVVLLEQQLDLLAASANRDVNPNDRRRHR